MPIVFTDENNRISLKHKKPLAFEESVREQGHLVDSLPDFKEKPRKRKNEYYTPTDGFWVEYVDRPLTDEEKLEDLKAEDLNNKEAIADLYTMTMGV